MLNRIISFEAACNQYKHRYTMEHVPEWAKIPCDNGKFYAPGYATDLEWYNKTLFPGESFIGIKETHCYSISQSFPLGDWLDKPYEKIVK